MEFIKYILNLILVVPIVLLLFFIAIRLGKTSLSKIGIYNYVSVLEKVNMGKDSSVVVLKVGEKGYVGVLAKDSFETICSLDEKEIQDIENKKNQILNQKKDFKFDLNKKVLRGVFKDGIK